MMFRCALLLLVCAAFAPVSCADTEGAVIPLEVAVRGSAATEPFETSTGWTVSLNEAWVALGAFRAYADSSFAQRMLSPNRAFAHGGTDPLNGRRVRAEWLEPIVVDALDPEGVVLGTIDAESGAVDEVGVTLDQPADGDTRGHVAWVAGSAIKDGDTIAFEGGLTLEDEPLVRRVENIPLEAELAAGDRWVLAADPRPWLADAIFDRLEESAGDVRTIESDSQVHGALRLGLRNPRAWSAEMERSE